MAPIKFNVYVADDYLSNTNAIIRQVRSALRDYGKVDIFGKYGKIGIFNEDETATEDYSIEVRLFTASNGKELVKKVKERIDEVGNILVLTDNDMPGKNAGLKAIEELGYDPKMSYKEDRGACLSFYLVSGDTDNPKLEQEVNSMGARFIPKPYEDNTIKKAVTDYVDLVLKERLK